MIKIIDRYIARELVGPFIFGIAAFSAILGGSTVLFPLVSKIVKYGIPLWETLQIVLYKLPMVIVYTFPMSMLLATILTVSRLSSDSEIIAFRACGISMYRIVTPIAVIGFVVSLASIWFNEAVVPKATYNSQILYESLTSADNPRIKRNINLTEYNGGLPVRTINILEVDQNNLKGITVAEYDEGLLARIIRAKSGKWITSGGWEFYDGIMHIFPPNDKYKVTIVEFKKEYIDITISPFSVNTYNKGVDEMNAQELAARIALKKRSGEDPTSDRVNWHMKFSIPFASLIFSILGASVGLRPLRSSSSLGLGMSLVIILIYYILISLCMGLGLSHLIPPILAAWLPNLLIGIVSIYLLRKVSG